MSLPLCNPTIVILSSLTGERFNRQPAEAVERQQPQLREVLRRTHQREELCRLGHRWGLHHLWVREQ